MREYSSPESDLSDDSLTPDHWPKGGQKLFRDDGHWAEVALIDKPGTWSTYVRSFRSAAELLYKAAFAPGSTTRDRDVAFPPFAFLWRHYTELALKASITLYSQYLNTEEDWKRLSGTHSLQALWDWCEYLGKQIVPEEFAEGGKHVKRIVGQLQAVDPTSMQFRYPVGKDGKPHLEGTNRVSMRNFHEQMLGLANWIEAGLLMVENELDLKLEYEEILQEEILDDL